MRYRDVPTLINFYNISAFKVIFILCSDTDIYVKNIDVPEGESVNVTMKTPATGSDEDGVYYLLVKPN